MLPSYSVSSKLEYFRELIDIDNNFKGTTNVKPGHPGSTAANSHPNNFQLYYLPLIHLPTQIFPGMMNHNLFQ